MDLQSDALDYLVRFKKKKSVPEYLVWDIWPFYSGCKTAALDGELSDLFLIHLGFIWSMFSLKQLLNAYNIVRCGKSVKAMERNGNSKKALQGKGLRVNVGKTERMYFMDSKKMLVAKTHLSDVCNKYVGCNSANYISNVR